MHSHIWLSFGKFQDTEHFLIHCERHFSSRLPSSGGTWKYAKVLSTKKTWRDSLPIDMILSAVSVLVVAQSSSEIPEGLMNNPVLQSKVLDYPSIELCCWDRCEGGRIGSSRQIKRVLWIENQCCLLPSDSTLHKKWTRYTDILGLVMWEARLHVSRTFILYRSSSYHNLHGYSYLIRLLPFRSGSAQAYRIGVFLFGLSLHWLVQGFVQCLRFMCFVGCRDHEQYIL